MQGQNCGCFCSGLFSDKFNGGSIQHLITFIAYLLPSGQQRPVDLFHYDTACAQAAVLTVVFTFSPAEDRKYSVQPDGSSVIGSPSLSYGHICTSARHRLCSIGPSPSPSSLAQESFDHASRNWVRRPAVPRQRKAGCDCCQPIIGGKMGIWRCSVKPSVMA